MRPTAEYERRAALVEIDALVAVWLGITEEQLEAIYPTRYPVLGKADRIAEYRQAHAAFTERVNAGN